MQGGQILYDIKDTFHGYTTARGPDAAVFSENRIFAHELGHVAGGSDADSWLFGKQMQNIMDNENTIMNELGDHDDRTMYK